MREVDMFSKFFQVLAAIVIFAGFSMTAHSADQPPIVFVHGDSDTAGLWMVQMWRFESNGYPRDRLFPVDIPHPSARGDDGKAEQNRSSTEDAALAVAEKVDEALAKSKASKVVLIANSRGCQTSRNYVKNFGGRDKVAAMILTGCVHRGVFVAPDFAPGSEYNGAGQFLTALNQPPVIPQGIPVTIIRSDKFDLYSQPDGKFIGNPRKPTGANFDSPELDGADNRVLNGVDHRETGYSPEAFKIMYTAVTGVEPQTTAITPEDAPVLSGKVSGFDNAAPTNMPLAGAQVSVFETDKATGAEQGQAVYEATVGEDGRWGPFTAKTGQAYEFVIRAPGQPVHRIYRSPFPRSSDVVNLRLYPAEAGDGTAIGVMRPRGYFGPEDSATANGVAFAEIDKSEPVPHVWKSRVAGASGDSVLAEFNGEKLAGRIPAQGEIAWIELTY
jgi:pimeloyl-ACP methyl ester carboxylesterase